MTAGATTWLVSAAVVVCVLGLLGLIVASLMRGDDGSRVNLEGRPGAASGLRPHTSGDVPVTDCLAACPTCGSSDISDDGEWWACGSCGRSLVP